MNSLKPADETASRAAGRPQLRPDAEDEAFEFAGLMNHWRSASLPAVREPHYQRGSGGLAGSGGTHALSGKSHS